MTKAPLFINPFFKSNRSSSNKLNKTPFPTFPARLQWEESVTGNDHTKILATEIIPLSHSHTHPHTASHNTCLPTHTHTLSHTHYTHFLFVVLINPTFASSTDTEIFSHLSLSRHVLDSTDQKTDTKHFQQRCSNCPLHFWTSLDSWNGPQQ